MSADVLPDPLDFVARALTARGALVEREDQRAVALLPAELARALNTPEEFTAAPVGDGDVIAAGVGSPLVERLAADARAAPSWCATLPTSEPPRVTHAVAMAARVVVRNGLVDVLDASTGEAVYLRASVAWAVEADDRYEGVTHALTGSDGGEPDASFARALDLSAADDDPRAVDLDPAAARSALAFVPARVAQALELATVDPIASIERRHARDHARMAEYFSGLITELGAGRRKVDPAALAAKAQTLAAERDARLGDLALRYAAKVSAAPVALVFARAPVARVRLRVRRRKADRELRVTLPGGAAALDRLLCEGCLGGTAKPAVCDDALHVLCERCVPQAQGRFECPACARQSPRRGR